ncbi:aldehyde dehydrogenase [Hyaloscypha variabilis F]|uniref:aldehyde dehydrogenase (NAD(+)) n=1 Tax=Hyaloscypha variabilis (strain UAMH 11265 / GT02V1 / F) TaxID=1149755 RepID=A0A2J6R281_HYAVF|nr:aldehyde dehydrogenase [Hyaloscypha variabilis F]
MGSQIGHSDGEALDFASFSNIIDGDKKRTESTIHGINPATLEALYPVPLSTKTDIDAAIAAARAAFKTWRKTAVEDRKQRLRAFAEGLLLHKNEFAHLLTKEQGKPLAVAESEVDNAARWLTGTAELDIPVETVVETPTSLIKTKYVPLGVVVGIVPWNFPLMLLTGKVGPAVLTGNCIIIKPSPFTPYCGLKAIELAQRYFPPGVIQALSGDDSLGPQLTARSDIHKISFTGSTATGKRVMESASKHLTRITLELGGNDPAIICPDVDVQAVAEKMAGLAFLNSGQVCIAVKRIYVHENIYEEFRAAMVKKVESYGVGNGLQKDVFLGPVQNRLQFDRVKEFLDDIRQEKQVVCTGGDVLQTKERGFFVQPTIVDNPPDDSKIVREEPFGPVVPLLRWADEEEVIARANDSNAGLGASVWSSDVEHARCIGEELEAGSVWINQHMGIIPTAHFAGHKSSGIGGEWGVDGLRGYCNTQTVFVNR